MHESDLVRSDPDMLMRSAKNTFDEPMWSTIVPDKPAAISMAGYSVFGPPAFQTTTRNMSMDIRGEAVTGPIVGQPPEGAMVPPMMGMVPGGVEAMAVSAARNGGGCPCNRNYSSPIVMRSVVAPAGTKPKVNFWAHPFQWTQVNIFHKGY
jgi:hypothetical protein